MQSGQLSAEVILNVFGDVESECMTGDFLSLLHRNVPDEVLNLGDGYGSHAERPKSHSDEKWNKSWLRTHLTADSYADAVTIGSVHNHLDQSKNRRIASTEQAGDVGVSPIDGQ